MNKDSLREYIFAAQRGDRKALVELLTYSWGIVHYQCGKLLPSRQSAEKMTTVVLKTVAEKLDSLQEPERFYNWMGHLTAMRCMRVRATLLENGQADAAEDKKSFSFPGMDLNKAETAQVAVMLADMLEDRQRLNLYLYSLSGLSAKAISQLTGYTEAAIQADLQDAQTAIQKQMQHYASQGVHFTQAESLPALLRTDMLLHQDPERAAQVVYEMLPSLSLPAAKRPAAKTAGRPAAPRPQQPSRPQQSQRPQQPQQDRPQPRPQQPQPRAKNKDAGLVKALALIAALLAVVLIVSVVILVVRTRSGSAAAAAYAAGSRTARHLFGLRNTFGNALIW